MDARSRDTVAAPLPSQVQTARRRLLLRDSLTFLTLTCVTVVLGGITTLLFRSFESHREDLAVRSAELGADAMAHGRPGEAVRALRTSLVYRPNARDTQLELAQALASDGHVAEAENYFLNLWQQQPGDGNINLALARVKRRQNLPLDAIEYYRAAVFGTWSGDAPLRRRDTRLELSDYLLRLGQNKAAQIELLITAGNNPDAATQLRIGKALERAGDAKDASAAYRNAEDDKQFGSTASARIGELCYSMGDYSCSSRELGKALRAGKWTAEQNARMGSMQQDAERLQVLSVSHDLPSTVRADHLLNNARIAQVRLKSCMKAQSDAETTDLVAQWKSLDTAANRNGVRRDDDLQDSYRNLIVATEQGTARICDAPTGDDALLLYLADHPATRFGAQQ